MRTLDSLSIRPLARGVAAFLLALPMVPTDLSAQTAPPKPRTSLADCDTPTPRPGKPRSSDPGCLAPCAASTKAPPPAAMPLAPRNIPVPGCQLAGRDTGSAQRQSG